jgi:hypothetical protein
LLLPWQRCLTCKIPLVVECLVWPWATEVSESVRGGVRADAVDLEHFEVVNELSWRQRMRRSWHPTINLTIKTRQATKKIDRFGSRTDVDVLSQLVREEICLSHFRISHPARDEHEQPLARFGRCTTRPGGAVPAWLCATQRGCRRCYLGAKGGRGRSWVVLDVRESSRIELAGDLVLSPYASRLVERTRGGWTIKGQTSMTVRRRGLYRESSYSSSFDRFCLIRLLRSLSPGPCATHTM